MDNYFFSKENIDKLTNQLGKSLNIKNTPESKRACRKFVETQMKSVFDKYSDKKPKKMPMPEFLYKLNQKSLDDCVKLYEVKTGKRTGNANAASMHIQRDREIYGNREQMMENRPMHTSGVNKEAGLPGMLDSGGGGNFAPLSSLAGPGEYITATGEMGSRMPFNDGNGGGGNMMSNEMGGGMGGDQGMYADKKHSIDDLERRMLERQTDYQARPMNMNSFTGGFGGAGSGMGGGMGVGMMYNPNPFGNNNQKPPEINFALDGGDTRRTKEREEFMRQATGNNMGQNDMMGNFTGFDGGMGGGMNFDMMGVGLMGNPLGGNNTPNNMQNNMGNMQNMQMMNNNMGNMQNMQIMGNNMGMQNMNMMGNNMGMQNMNMMGNNMGKMNNMGNDHSRFSENDLKKKLNEMMNDRKSVTVPKNGQFNPMMSPNMNNMNMNNVQGGNVQQMLQNQNMMSGNNNLNFHKGGQAGLSDNLMQISSAKNSVASSYGIDLKKIQTMSSKDIEKIIDKIKNNVMVGAEEIANKGSENIEKSDKKKLLDLIKQAKKLNKKKGKEIMHESSDEDSASEPKSKKKVKFQENKEESKVKPKRAKLISINAEEHTEPEYFNDYMVDLPDKFKDVTGIEVLDYSFPKDLCKITKDNNQLMIIIEGEEKLIELEDGTYSIDEIVDGLQSAFEAEEMKINIEIDEDEHIVLSSSEQEFNFRNDEKSLGRVLGFTEELYENKLVYVSENKHSLVSKIYMYIDNISKEEPFGMIDLKANKIKPIIKRFNQPLSEIKEMILKFKRRPTKEDDLIDFSKKPHKLTFKFESKS